MTARGTPSRFLQSVLQNGVGRYVCQLKRISLIFSKKGQGSLGVRYGFTSSDLCRSCIIKAHRIFTVHGDPPIYYYLLCFVSISEIISQIM